MMRWNQCRIFNSLKFWEMHLTVKYLSVVGSGPIRMPGKSCSSRYLMNVVLPVEYCPTNITIGRASKSGSSSAGE